MTNLKFVLVHTNVLAENGPLSMTMYGKVSKCHTVSHDLHVATIFLRSLATYFILLLDIGSNKIQRQQLSLS